MGIPITKVVIDVNFLTKSKPKPMSLEKVRVLREATIFIKNQDGKESAKSESAKSVGFSNRD